MDDEIRGIDDELGDAGQLGAHVLEHAGEGGHHQPEHERHGEHGDDRSGSSDTSARPLTLRRGLAGLADLLVEFQEHRAHLAGDFAGADDLDPVVLEDWG